MREKSVAGQLAHFNRCFRRLPSNLNILSQHQRPLCDPVSISTALTFKILAIGRSLAHRQSFWNASESAYCTKHNVKLTSSTFLK
ncbi:MAG: hypothetical protein CMQ45_00770 [Gammaproteobacteria bacterium]|nr:hypothetical protein [Gammaproteobacteria bacterium]